MESAFSSGKWACLYRNAERRIAEDPAAQLLVSTWQSRDGRLTNDAISLSLSLSGL